MQKIKTIYQQLEHCSDDLERVDLLADLSTEFLNSDVKRCIEVVDQLGELAKKLGHPKALGFYYSSLGRIKYKQSKFAHATTAFKIAIDYAKAAGSTMLESNCYHSLGMVYWKEGLFDESLEVSLKSLKYFDGQSDPTGNQALCYNNVGNIYERMGEYDKAEEYYKQGMEMLKTIGEERTMYNIMGNLGVIKIRKGEFKAAFKYLEPVHVGFKKLQHHTGETLTLVHIGQAYIGLKQYAKAMKFFIQALKLLKTNEFKFAEADVYRGFGNVYMGMEAFDEALKHYEKGMEIVKSIDYYSGICEFHINYAEVYMAVGNMDAAAASVNEGLAIAIKRKLPLESKKLEAVKEKLLSQKSQVA